MWYYIFQIILFQALFLLVYDFFLKRETFFNWNRVYLLKTPLLSFALPFIKIPSFKSAINTNYITQLPEVVIGTLKKTSPNLETEEATAIINTTQTWFTWELLLYVGAIVFAIVFLYKILKITYLIKTNKKRWYKNILIVKIPNSLTAFSFFHYVFIGETISAEKKQTILRHELVHVNQKHTLDLLFFEILKIVFWFNPLTYIYQKRISELHEFIADAKAIKQTSKSDYYKNLLSQVFQTNILTLVNPFFKQSLIKKRIDMLSKSKSKQQLLLKYAIVIPVVVTMLVFSSAEAQEQDYSHLSDAELKEKFYNEILNIEEQGGNSMEFFEKHILENHKKGKFILNRVEYYKNNAFYRYMRDKSIERQINTGKPIVENKNFNKITDRTYKEYLEYKKTDEAKESWENSVHKGVRLVVNDLNNFTKKEQEKYEVKLKLFHSDDWFETFTITDGKNTKEILNADAKKDLQIVTKKETVEVPFTVIDEAPIYPGCTAALNQEQKTCFSNKISKHVATNFNTQLADSLGLKGRQRISTIFKINKEGDVEGIRVRAPHPLLEKEVDRVLLMLPKMIPGKHEGKEVDVLYSLPIVFEIKSDNETPKQETLKKDNNPINGKKTNGLGFKELQINPTIHTKNLNSLKPDVSNGITKILKERKDYANYLDYKKKQADKERWIRSF